VGLSLDLGPLRFAGPALVAVILLGQLGRLAGSWGATARSSLSPADRTLAAASYVPKATIQVAFGGLALDRGLAEGELILTGAVLAVVLCAPVGATAMRWAAAAPPGLPAFAMLTRWSRRTRGPGGRRSRR
jgi:solute carrier family 9B (sodium/hydrogen exchanger), member 1/2